MADASSYFLKSKGSDLESCRRLISLGQKHRNLLGLPSPYTIPILGLRGNSYVSMIEHPEAKIEFLRGAATQNYDQTQLDSLIIRIQVSVAGNLKHYEYLTASPSPASSQSGYQ